MLYLLQIRVREGSGLLIIKSIRIEGFGGIDHFESSFDPRIVLLSGEKAGTVMAAIGKLLGYGAIVEPDLHGTGDSSLITAEIELNGETCRVTSNHQTAMLQNREERAVSCYPARHNGPFAERLLRYKETEEYYAADAFAGQTAGIGATRTFRACLNSFIRNYQPEPLINSPEHRITLLDSGLFVAEREGSPGRRAVLSATEKALFEFQCFLQINAFWENVESIRDLNHASWPLFITDPPELIYPSAGKPEWLEKAGNLGRQVFLLNTKPKKNDLPGRSIKSAI